MKITLAQLNLKVGDIENNIKKAKDAYIKAERENSDIIIYPELLTTGYQPLDMIANTDFIKENIKAVKDFSMITKKTAAVIGYVDFNKGYGKKFLNSAAFIQSGKIIYSFSKNLLPTYDIFDEKRYFNEGNNYRIIKFKGKKILITICEDIWSQTELLPDKNLYSKNIIKDFNPELIINLSASPYYYGKAALRKKILSRLAQEKKADIVYVNTVGANDELVFDGSSMLIKKNGDVYTAAAFEEEVITIDDSVNKNIIDEDLSFIENAIITGIRDYFIKQNFKTALIGVSGGIDSAIVLYLTSKAIGNKNVRGILMPSKFTSKQSIDDALKLLKNLDVGYDTISIDSLYKQYIKTLKLDESNIDITLQNIQSRIRGNILMSYSNRYNSLVMTTGNKSEIGVGYSTLYGDSCGAIAPIGDLTKTDVYKLANYINRNSEIIPYSIIQRPPTAELKYNQRDDDDLPQYSVLDKIIKLYIEEGKTPEMIKKITGMGSVVEDIIKRIERNEYKRRQMPLILKLSKKAFGSGRRMPIVKKIYI